jgi:glycine/D-amino acid oxidase-like deaminating enzyme
MDLKSGFPLWPVNDGLIATYPHLDGDARCDVVVLGAGISGALVAFHLVDAGFDVMVLDRRDVGWGSTAASTAILQYEIDVPLTELAERLGAEHAGRAYLACRDAIEKLAAVVERTGASCGFDKKKSLYLASKKRDRKLLQREHDARRALGIDVDYLDETDIAARFSFRRPAALLSRDAAQLDAYALTHALLQAAIARGARVFDRTGVTHIETTAQNATLMTDEKCLIHARHLVFASGYETRDFLKQDVAKLASTYAFASEPMSTIPGWNEDRCIIWEHASPYLYLRTTVDNRIIVGGEDEAFRDPARRDRLLPRKTERLLERFRELFPDVDLRVAFSWCGTFGETKDGLPYIGVHPDWPSASFALGYGGNGITFSLLAAEIIRDALLERPNPDAELFRFDR